MTTRKNTFIDAYGIELNDDLNGQYAEQQPHDDRDLFEVSRPPAHANTAPTVRRQYRFDQPHSSQPHRRQPHSGPHFEAPANEPETPETTWADMSVIDVGAGWNSQPQGSAPIPDVSVEPTPTAPETTSRPTTIAEATPQPTTIAEATPQPTTIAWTPVAKAPVEATAAVEQPIRVPIIREEAALAPVVEAPVAEAPVVEAPVIEAPVIEAPVIEAPVIEAPVIEAPVVEAPVAEIPIVEAPVAETPIVQAFKTETVDGNKIDNSGPVQEKVADTPDSPATTPIVAAWEVDRFAWPEDVEALFAEQTDYFEHAGHKLLEASREGLSKLAITSASPGEGTTTMTLCLARAVAAVGGRVAVLDGNLRNSQLGRALNLEIEAGWQGAAAGAVELAEAAIAGLEERITLFPAATAVGTISRLADESVRDVLRRAAAGFDLLLIDAGQDDFGENAGEIDAAMVVRDVRRTSEQESLAAALQLRDAGVKAVGIAENFSEPRQTAAAA